MLLPAQSARRMQAHTESIAKLRVHASTYGWKFLKVEFMLLLIETASTLLPGGLDKCRRFSFSPAVIRRNSRRNNNTRDRPWPSLLCQPAANTLTPLGKHHATNASEVRICKHDGTMERMIVQFFNHASRDTAVC